MTTSATTVPSRPAGPSLRASLLLLAAVVTLWGAHWPIMKVGLAHVGPLWFNALRFLTGGLSLFLVVALLGRLRVPPRRDWPLLLSVGLGQMMLFGVLVMYALRHVPAGRSAVLAYTTTLWVTPLSVLILGETVSRRKVVGTVLGLAGIAVLFNPLTLDWSDRAVVVGNLILLVAALVWALCILHIRAYRGLSSTLELAPWQMLLAAVPVTGAALWIEGPHPGDGTLTFFLVAAYAGPLATGFCFWAVNQLTARLPAATFSNAMLAVPMSGILFSAAALGDLPSGPVLLGMAIILAGMATVVAAERR
ncbi:DMT family transporter [Azospirillum oleiclasticum]|uniref:DMT family transporter n=1 Tax=Azospirillum oleiclasticum TaxID=2735135 RepID=UPI001FEA30DA|nr:DMT family transporter [Azospirillum oleiclasticum]